MPLLKVNATATGLLVHGTLMHADYKIRELSDNSAPVVIMVHGYKYAPGTMRHCPHNKIFGSSNEAWPKSFGFGIANSDEGLCIPFGWYARGSLAKAHRRANLHGKDLARVVQILHSTRPGRPVHIVAHSLGVELAMSALPHLPARAIDKMVLMTGACFEADAKARMTSPAGITAKFLNVISRENDVFDVIFEHLVPSRQAGSGTIGQGIKAPNVVNLQIDCAQTIDTLNKMSFPVAPAQRRVCHWSAYQRAGLLSLYNRFLRKNDELSLRELQKSLPTDVSPRWSRLFPFIVAPAPASPTCLHRVLHGLGFPQGRTGPAATRRNRYEHAH